jgi:septal ring factor EnvC (AmiA/AmiB activator)
MGGNSRTTFAKRQKERARQEKQAEKAQRKAERKSQQKDQVPSAPSENPVVTYDEEGNPEGLSFHDF